MIWHGLLLRRGLLIWVRPVSSRRREPIILRRVWVNGRHVWWSRILRRWRWIVSSIVLWRSGIGLLRRILEEKKKARDDEFPCVPRALEEKDRTASPAAPPFFESITYRIMRLLVGISARAIGVVGGRIWTRATWICIGRRRILAPATGVSVGMAGHWGVYERGRGEEKRGVRCR
jgi:hypothetical protein